jgi:hypothetical protein
MTGVLSRSNHKMQDARCKTALFSSVHTLISTRLHTGLHTLDSNTLTSQILTLQLAFTFPLAVCEPFACLTLTSDIPSG